MAQWHQVVYNNGVAMDRHNAVTMDRASSHRHAVDLRCQHPCPLVNEPALLLSNNIELLLFSRRVNKMIDQLERIRPVVYANNLLGNIDAQRDARRIKLLRELRPTLHALRTHRLPRYPCYLLAHPNARQHSTLASLAQQRDIPRVACF